MFYAWGRFSYAHRKVVPLVIVGLILLLFFGFGTRLGERMSQEGWEDPGAASTSAAKIEQETFGRDNSGDVVWGCSIACRVERTRRQEDHDVLF